MSEKQFLLQIANREVELEFKEEEASNRISITSLESWLIRDIRKG